MIYTVEQIVQAIGTLERPEKERLMRTLASLEQGPEAARRGPGAEPDGVLTYEGESEGGEGCYALWARGDVAPRLRSLPLSGAESNSEAEYDALLAGLQGLLDEAAARGQDPAGWSVEIRGASRLVVQQVMGLWRPRGDRLLARRDRALALLGRLGSYRFREMSSSEVSAALSACSGIEPQMNTDKRRLGKTGHG